MGDYGGPQLLADSVQHHQADLSFLHHNFSSLDFFHRQNPFGFSPGTSPVPNGMENEGLESFFDPKIRELPSNDFKYNPSWKGPSYDAASLQPVQPLDQLHIPSAKTNQKHGQLTPPSETTPTKESPPAEALQDLLRSPVDTKNGPKARKRTSTRSSAVADQSGQNKTTPRRRKKSTRKQSSAEPAADGDGKRSQFLERNRVAASKCRQKKKEWTSNLEQRARELQANKTSLALLVSSLREELLYLKGEALRHTTCDCDGIREYLARHAEASFPQSHLDFVHSPNSASDFSLEAMDLDPSLMEDTPDSSAMADIQDLPELNLLGQIPD